MTFTHGSYTVAWVCALPLELAAAKAVLDELHPLLPQPKSDQNVYMLGSVSGHNIVLACFPAGIYGTISATAVVSHLMSTYPNIRFGLMVGIGGGVPSENPDIRLGDIVVSKPTDTSSGVIQYDYGKAHQNGHFYPTGFLQKPPPLLLKAVAQTESDYILGKSPFGEIMSRPSHLQKEEAQRLFRRPSNDKLFHPTYNHEQYKEAKELEEHVLWTRKQVLGPDHPDTLAIMTNVACTYRCQGQYKEAEELEVQVLRTCKQALGPDHPDTLGKMVNLACTYKCHRRYKEAEKLESEVLQTSKQVLGTEHPDTLTAMANLASTYQHQKQYTSAEELGAQILQARKRVLGTEHPSTLSSMASLAYTWHFQNKTHDALALMKGCVTLRSRILGASHPLTQSSSHSLRAWEDVN